MKGNGVMTIRQIIRRRKQEQLRHHRVMASIIAHELATTPDDIPEVEEE